MARSEFQSFVAEMLRETLSFMKYSDDEHITIRYSEKNIVMKTVGVKIVFVRTEGDQLNFLGKRIAFV